jgi:hypothetical protein
MIGLDFNITQETEMSRQNYAVEKIRRIIAPEETSPCFETCKT